MATKKNSKARVPAPAAKPKADEKKAATRKSQKSSGAIRRELNPPSD